MKAARLEIMLKRGIEEHRSGNLVEARKSYKSVLARERNHVGALHLLGVLEAQLGKSEAALALLDRALKLAPNSADVMADKGRVLTESKRHADAIECYQHALSVNPGHLPALHNLGCSFLTLGRPSEALDVFDRLIALAPRFLPALHNRGIALTDLNRYDQAVQSFSDALSINPDYAEALHGRGIAFEALSRHDLAYADFRNAVRIAPQLDYLLGCVVGAQLYCHEFNGLNALRSALIAGIEAGKKVVTPFLFLCLSDSPKHQLACAKIYVDDKYPAVPRPVQCQNVYQHERVRLGYFSSDFRDHPVAHLIAGIFEHHDRSQFDTFAISHGPDDGSDIRRRIQGSFEHFIEAYSMGDAALAQVIAQNEIDILVDLNGFTQNNRFGVLARKAAPIQVSYWGYPGTTGASYVDYIIADRWVIPERDREYYSEKVVYLPGSYQPNDACRLISKESIARTQYGLPEKGFVFCCFNSPHKITPEMIDVWMRVLGAVPNSVLWLMEGNSVARSNLCREAAERGIAPERLVFARKIPMADHLGRYRLADLFLDTLPYNAHTTASDALWVGLPVLTCVGNSFAGRAGASVLDAIGLPELMATSLDLYEKMAVDLANNPTMLASIKEKLNKNRLVKPLFDAKRITEHLEHAYLAMYDRKRAGLPADHIVV